MDPDILRDLELRLIPSVEIRLLWMGLSVPRGLRWTHAPMPQYDFARQLLQGPWDQVVRRRELVRQQRLQQLFWDYVGEQYFLSVITDRQARIQDHLREYERLTWG